MNPSGGRRLAYVRRLFDWTVRVSPIESDFNGIDVLSVQLVTRDAMLEIAGDLELGIRTHCTPKYPARLTLVHAFLRDVRSQRAGRAARAAGWGTRRTRRSGVTLTRFSSSGEQHFYAAFGSGQRRGF